MSARMSWSAQIWERFFDRMGGALPQMAVLLAVGAAVFFALSRRNHDGEVLARWVERLCVAVALGVGAYVAVSKASLFDDAYISFRYSKNFAEGNGLVFNLGEPVEGYTNFLWTFLIGALVKLTPFEAPEIGVVLSLVAFLANLVVIAALSRVLRAGEGLKLFLPVAVLLLAVQDTFTCYGTTGLETGFASLLVNSGLYFLLTAERPGRIALSGLFLIFATLTRPDHALFYAVGSGVVVLSWARPILEARSKGLGAMWKAGGVFFVAYAAPFVLYAAYLAWKVSFYGELLPNTYYAKSADLTYYSQGVHYAHVFYLASHMWLVVPMFILGALLPSKSDATFRFRWFALVVVALYNVYILKVGGDFMMGRFYVSLMPLYLLGAERAVSWLLDEERRSRQQVSGVVLAGLLCSTAGGLAFYKPYEIKWHICDERTFYPLTKWFPATVDHSNYRLGKALGKLHDAGIDPLVATSGVGMLGYYSMVPILDRVGLVDKTVARIKIEKRGRPGHEKWAPDWYIKERAPHFIRGGKHIPERYQKLTRMDFGKGSGRRRWDIYRFDKELMAELKGVLPDARFIDVEVYLDDYLKSIDTKKPAEIKRDLAFFMRYYFEHNEDDARLNAIKGALEPKAPPPVPAETP